MILMCSQAFLAKFALYGHMNISNTLFFRLGIEPTTVAVTFKRCATVQRLAHMYLFNRFLEEKEVINSSVFFGDVKFTCNFNSSITYPL